jgi:WD40 repeat protein
MRNMKTIVLVIVMVATGCAQPSPTLPLPSASSSPTATHMLTLAPSATSTMTASNTPTPTITPTRTLTPIPPVSPDFTSSREIFHLPGHYDVRTAVAANPNATQIALARNADIEIWDVDSGQLSSALVTGHTDVITAVAWSSDGAKIATASDDGTVRVFSLVNSQDDFLLTLVDPVLQVKWSPDGTLLATVSHYYEGNTTVQLNTITIWEVITRHEVATATIPVFHGLWRTYLSWSPDSHQIVISTKNSSAMVIDAAKGASITQAIEADLVGSVYSDFFDATWSPTGQYIAVAGKEVFICDLNIKPCSEFRWTDESTEGDHAVSVRWSPDGTMIAVGYSGVRKSDITRIWQLREVEEPDPTLTLALMQTLPGWRVIAWSADGRRIATMDDTTIYVWQASEE